MSDVSRWPASSRLWTGNGALEACLQESSLPLPALIAVDRNVARTYTGGRILQELTAVTAVPPVEVDGSVTPATVAALVARADEVGAGMLVGLGGGATLDLVKLAALPVRVRHHALRSGGRSGLVLLSATRDQGRMRLLVPTTVGTGSETSQAACWQGAQGKVLCVGAPLRAELAVLEPRAVQELPELLLREGLLEVVSRLLVPYACGVAASAAAELVSEAHLLADLRLLGGVAAQVDDPAKRHALALVSAHSHAGWDHLGRPPFASPVWYVAAELAEAAGVRKMTATAAVLPAWSLAAAGSAAWGDASRLAGGWTAFVAGWQAVAARPFELSLDPVDGIARLCARWLGHDDTSSRVDVVDVEQVATQCARRWGAGLPMLSAYSRQQLLELLQSARRSNGARTPQPVPS